MPSGFNQPGYEDALRWALLGLRASFVLPGLFMRVVGPAANLLDQPAFNRNRDERRKIVGILSVNARIQMDVGRTKGAAAAPSVQPNLTSVITRQAMKTVSPTIKRMA